MTETVLRPSQLDTFVRERVNQVLITSCSTTTKRLLHLMSDKDWMEPVCNAQKHRGEWYDKPISVYPPDYHRICPHCVEQQFGVEVVDE